MNWMILERYKPGVGKHILLLLSGVLWIGVGFMLLTFAVHWLSVEQGAAVLVPAVLGITISFVIHHFGLLKVVDKNLGRILPMEGKRCLFAFQSWKSYIIIVVMVGMGITLRHSPIPKPYLAIFYIGMGLALILSSFRYLHVFLKQHG